MRIPSYGAGSSLGLAPSTYEAAKKNVDDYTAHRSEDLDSLPEFGYVKYQTGTTSCVAFASFGRFYIEITMFGYVTGDAALADAREFLAIYKQKIAPNDDNEVSVAVRVERRSAWRRHYPSRAYGSLLLTISYTHSSPKHR